MTSALLLLTLIEINAKTSFARFLALCATISRLKTRTRMHTKIPRWMCVMLLYYEEEPNFGIFIKSADVACYKAVEIVDDNRKQ